MAATGLHISISAETIANLGGLSFSNSMFTSILVSSLIIAVAFIINRQLVSTNRPKGLQNFAEWIIESLFGLVQSITNNDNKTRKFFPFIATFFLFIMLNNWFGLLPGVGTIGFTETETGEHEVAFLPQEVGLPVSQAQAAEEVHADTVVEETAVQDTHAEPETAVDEHAEEVGEAHQTFVPYLRAGTADLNTTLALGLISIFMTQVFGVQYLGLKYFTKFINFSSPIMFFVGLLELVSEFAKIISFAFRLFGNIFAGEVLLVVISFLAAIAVPIPFYGLEIFVGLVQALVFAMLTSVFFNMATQGHDDH